MPDKNWCRMMTTPINNTIVMGTCWRPSWVGGLHTGFVVLPSPRYGFDSRQGQCKKLFYIASGLGVCGTIIVSSTQVWDQSIVCNVV